MAAQHLITRHRVATTANDATERSFTITEGPAEVMRMTIARRVLEQYA